MCRLQTQHHLVKHDSQRGQDGSQRAIYGTKTLFVARLGKPLIRASRCCWLLFLLLDSFPGVGPDPVLVQHGEEALPAEKTRNHEDHVSWIQILWFATAHVVRACAFEKY